MRETRPPLVITDKSTSQQHNKHSWKLVWRNQLCFIANLVLKWRISESRVQLRVNAAQGRTYNNRNTSTVNTVYNLCSKYTLIYRSDHGAYKKRWEHWTRTVCIYLIESVKKYSCGRKIYFFSQQVQLQNTSSSWLQNSWCWAIATWTHFKVFLKIYCGRKTVDEYS